MGRTKQSKLLLISLFICLVVISVLSLFIGRYTLSPSECLGILTNGLLGTPVTNGTAINVILRLRLPRAIGAMLIGSSLALSGLSYQGVFDNILISPDILGVSAGSCVGAAVGIILNFPSSMIMGLAFIGGIIAVCISLLIPKVIHNSSNLALVLSGVIVCALMNSIIGLLKYIADPSKKLSEITFWIMGSIAGIEYGEILVVLPIIVFCSCIIWLLRWKINILSIGEESSVGLGVNYRITRILIIICCTLLTACSVSISGTIGWVGLVVPHIARFISDSDHRISVPVTMLLGAIFMVVVDTIARSVSINEIPLSIITGFIGTPLYIGCLARRRVIN